MGQDTKAANAAPTTAEIEQFASLMKGACEGDTAAERGLCFHAATGSIGYQRAIFDGIMEEGQGSLESLVRGEILARLIASHGSLLDQMVLAGLLRSLAEQFRAIGHAINADYYAGEAARALIHAADKGSGEATEGLASLVAEFPAAKEMADAASEAKPAGDPYGVMMTGDVSEGPAVTPTAIPTTRWCKVKVWAALLWVALRGLGGALLGRS